MSFLHDLIVGITDFFCGYPLFFWLIGGGLFLFVYSGAIPLRRIGSAIRALRVRNSGEGQISSFQALMSAISATVGMGNIAGVAIALVVGGPGAIFWMWVSALVGMATKFFEGTLAIMYKGRNREGEVKGGPMYVITEGLGPRFKPLAIMFACVGLVGCLCLLQANQLVEAIVTIFIPQQTLMPELGMKFICGIVLTGLVTLVVLGGLTRIANVATKMVPAMVSMYFLLVLFIIVTNLGEVPRVFGQIISGAFSLKAGLGGLAGVAVTGARRAMYVNEAGVGTAMLMHGASGNKVPVREGFVAMLCPAIDSGLVCTLTAIPIIMADCYHVEGVQGLTVALGAFDTLIPYVGKYFLMAMVAVFAFSTMFSYSYYGRACAEYLWGKDKAGYYDIFYLLSLLVASVITLDVAVSILDLCFALMSVPTMFAVLRLSPRVIKEFRNYENK
ncbi:MAG: alanine:cation symporter family protein [Bacteroidales bacterium]|nr:alanine:cation symporter family protein [Bacteroidales bacterium]